MAGRPILVTGGTGFVGRHLVRRLVGDGCDVVVLTRGRRKGGGEGTDNVQCIELPEPGGAALAASLRDVDFGAVCHLAAYGVKPSDRDVAPMIAVNVNMTADLVQLAADRSAVMVTTGSSAEYAEAADRRPITEDAPLETARLYGASKAAGGVLARAVARRLGVPLIHLRLFNVYGPGEAEHRLLPSLVRRLTAGERVPLSAGTQVRDFIHVSDVIKAIVRALAAARAGADRTTAVLNVSTGKGESVRAFAETVAAWLGAAPDRLDFGAMPMRPDELPWLVGSPARCRAALNWQARLDMQTGLRCALADAFSAANGAA